MIPVIYDCCYSCKSSLVIKQICRHKNMPIKNIYKDKCANYNPRNMKKCEICNHYIIELRSHVKNYHNMTTTEYIIATGDKETDKSRIKRSNVWDM